MQSDTPPSDTPEKFWRYEKEISKTEHMNEQPEQPRAYMNELSL